MGGPVLALILLYIMLYGVGGTVKSLVYYDARANLEILTGLISAMSSHSGSFRITYTLPPRECTIEVTENKVKVKFPAVTARLGTGMPLGAGKLPQSEGELFIIKPDYVKVKPFSTSCIANAKKTILIYKEGNEIGLVEA